MKTVRIIAPIILALISFSGLSAQVFFETFVAWQTCDWGRWHNNDENPRKHHIMMMGDSNGALWKAEPLFLQRWESFLNREGVAPSHDGTWRVLPLAFPASTSDSLLAWLDRCIGAPGPDWAAMPESTDEEKAARAAAKKAAEEKEVRRANFRRTTPKRAWIQIGGNDIINLQYKIHTEYMPHLAHYEINIILNRIGRIVELLQAEGVTVLLVSYFPMAAAYVRGEPDTSREAFICGGSPDSELNEIIDPLYCDNPVAKNYKKFKTWLNDRLGWDFGQFLPNPIVVDPFTGQIIMAPDILFNRKLQLRDLDIMAGQMLGLESSLTGFFKNPAKVIQKTYDRVRGKRDKRVDWKIVWDWIQHSPRGVVGWQLAQAGNNRNLMNSITLLRLGERYAEVYAAQNTHIAGYRGTVSFLDIAPDFKDPYVPYGGKNIYYADEKHLNNEGFKVYGHRVAEFMSLAEYDIYFSDEEFVKANQKKAVVHVESPINEDLALLAACFFLGICTF